MASSSRERPTRAEPIITDRKRAEIYADHTKGIQNIIHSNSQSEEISATKRFFARATTAGRMPDQSSPFFEAFARGAASAFAAPSTHSDADLPQAFATTAEPTVIHHYHHNSGGSGVPWWLVYLMMSRNNAPQQQTNTRDNQPRESNFGSWMGALIIAAVVAGPALAGTVYLLSELWNNLERLYYNEGYIQAGLGLANIILSMTLATVFTQVALSSAITALCVSAGFANPIGWAFFLLGCITMMTAGFTHLAIQEGIYRATAHANPDALHPEEPFRFTVTDQDIAELQRKDKKTNKHINGDNMQNVITAIHHDMTENPSRMERIFRFSPLFRSADTAKQLAEIRKVRTTGKVTYVTEIEPADDNYETVSFNTKSLF